MVFAPRATGAHPFVAIDRTSKFAIAELSQSAERQDACDFLRRLIEVAPYKIHTILTDNGLQFTRQARSKRKSKLEFDKICEAHGIERRLTKPYHPWTNGQVERMNRSHEELRQRFERLLQAYNFAKRFKTLKGRSPYEYICERWRENPERFRQNPPHPMRDYTATLLWRILPHGTSKWLKTNDDDDAAIANRA